MRPTVQVPAGVWTQLSTADVTAISVQNQNGYMVHLMVTAGAVAPTTTPPETPGDIQLFPGVVWAADLSLAQLRPGVTGTRVYAYSTLPARLSVSHA